MGEGQNCSKPTTLINVRENALGYIFCMLVKMELDSSPPYQLVGLFMDSDSDVRKLKRIL